MVSFPGFLLVLTPIVEDTIRQLLYLSNMSIPTIHSEMRERTIDGAYPWGQWTYEVRLSTRTPFVT